MARTGIRRIKGEEYPFGGQDGGQGSFGELFDGDSLDDETVLREAARLHEQKSQRETGVRKYPPPQETLDLHGCTALEAEEMSRRFIKEANQRSLKTVRIITGKGLHSPGGKAVLPDAIEQLVVILKKEGVVASFAWEKKVKSKSGALLVYL